MDESEFILQQTEKEKRIWWIVDHSGFSITMIFLLVAVVKFSVDRLFRFQSPLFPPVPGDVLDAVITAAFAAAAFGGFLRLAVLRKRYLQRELWKVATLNHHVRNSLQVILGTEMTRSEPAQGVIESVDRIERTLKELYPSVWRIGEERRAVPRTRPTSRTQSDQPLK